MKETLLFDAKSKFELTEEELSGLVEFFELLQKWELESKDNSDQKNINLD